jgi:hypothetical protein
MKRMRMDLGVKRLRLLYQSTNQASMPSVGMRVMISKMRQKMKHRPEKDMSAVDWYPRLLQGESYLVW